MAAALPPCEQVRAVRDQKSGRDQGWQLDTYLARAVANHYKRSQIQRLYS